MKLTPKHNGSPQGGDAYFKRVKKARIKKAMRQKTRKQQRNKKS